jgi:sugar lactone lactonase YvrE
VRWLTGLLIGLVALLGGTLQPGTALAGVERLASLPAGNAAYGISVGNDGLLYASSAAGLRYGTIFVYDQSGNEQDRIIVNAGLAGVVSLRGVAHDQFGNLFVADAADGQPRRGRIIKITPRGRQTVFASGLSGLGGLAFDHSGVLYVADGLNGAVAWYGQDGASASFVEDDRLRGHARQDLGATGLAFNADDSLLYISNASDDRILRQSINPDGSAGRLSTFADGAVLRRTSSTGAALDGAAGLAVDSRGNLLVAASRANEVELISSEGRLVGRVPAGGRGSLASPTGLALYGRLIFVANLAAEYSTSHLSRFWLSEFDS